MKKSLFALLVALTATATYASDYFVVVPVKGRTVTAPAIAVVLNDYSLPTANQGLSYGPVDLKPLLSVSGDPAYTGSGVTWGATALPAGLALDGSGVLSGVPSQSGSFSVSVDATYKSVKASHLYALTVNPLVNIKNFGTYRAWSDGNYATSCLGYATPGAGHAYTGDVGNGVYKIQPAGQASPQAVYCDMTSGGWTLLMLGSDNIGLAGWYAATGNYNVPAAPAETYNATWKYADTFINAVPKTVFKVKSVIGYTGTWYASGACVYGHQTAAAGACAKIYSDEALTNLLKTGTGAANGISDNNGSGYHILTNNSATYASYGWCTGTGAAGAGGCGGGGTDSSFSLWVK